MEKVRLTRKKILAVSIMLLFIIFIEVYAHTYVLPNYITVTPKDNARPVWLNWDTPSAWLKFGNYTFSKNNCNWLVEWCLEQDKQEPNGHFYIIIFKTGENATFLTSTNGIAFSSLKIAPSNPLRNSTIIDLDALPSYNTKTNLNYKCELSFHGDNEINLSLTVKFYQETILGIIPTGEQTIPIQATLS
jgi:hypothetical protein